MEKTMDNKTDNKPPKTPYRGERRGEPVPVPEIPACVKAQIEKLVEIGIPATEWDYDAVCQRGMTSWQIYIEDQMSFDPRFDIGIDTGLRLVGAEFGWVPYDLDPTQSHLKGEWRLVYSHEESWSAPFDTVTVTTFNGDTADITVWW